MTTSHKGVLNPSVPNARNTTMVSVEAATTVESLVTMLENVETRQTQILAITTDKGITTTDKGITTTDKGIITISREMVMHQEGLDALNVVLRDILRKIVQS